MGGSAPVGPHGLPIVDEVAADEKSVTLLKKWQDAGKAEIGSHLHPWTTPPITPGEEDQRTFPNELSDADLRAKFVALHEKITEAFGKAPTSYRAGRWGFDARQARLLQEFSYVFDSSITPGISWVKSLGKKDGNGGPDFSKESAKSKMLSATVLEVPMTILPTGFFGIKTWLRIFENTTKARLEKVLNAAERRGLPTVVFMIHSSELVAGKSPYVKTPEALEHVYARLEELFVVCKEMSIESIMASKFSREFSPNIDAAG